MSKLRKLSGEEVIKILQRMGFKKVRQRGSHVVMRKGNRGCVVPLHKELKTGTLRGILKQAQISPEEFNKYI